MYGFKKVNNHYETQDKLEYPPEDIEKLFRFLEVLPQSCENEKEYEVIFMLGDLMVTNGNIDKDSGRGTVFGFNSKMGFWMERPITVCSGQFLVEFMFDNIIIDIDGKAIGAVKRVVRE